jgi:hypothetical protein
MSSILTYWSRQKRQRASPFLSSIFSSLALSLRNFGLDLEIGIGSGFHRPNQLFGKSTAHSAFASYAAADRPRVLDRVAELVNVASIDVFVDCLSLHPGEKCEKTFWVERSRVLIRADVDDFGLYRQLRGQLR